MARRWSGRKKRSSAEQARREAQERAEQLEWVEAPKRSAHEWLEAEFSRLEISTMIAHSVAFRYAQERGDHQVAEALLRFMQAYRPRIRRMPPEVVDLLDKLTDEEYRRQRLRPTPEDPKPEPPKPESPKPEEKPVPQPEDPNVFWTLLKPLVAFDLPPEPVPLPKAPPPPIREGEFIGLDKVLRQEELMRQEGRRLAEEQKRRRGGEWIPMEVKPELPIELILKLQASTGRKFSGRLRYVEVPEYPNPYRPPGGLTLGSGSLVEMGEYLTADIWRKDPFEQWMRGAYILESHRKVGVVGGHQQWIAYYRFHKDLGR